MKLEVRLILWYKAEASGKLKDGDTVVAASSGNTGASVAMIGAMRGYKVFVITSPKCSQEKIATIEAYGATVYISLPGERLGEAWALVCPQASATWRWPRRRPGRTAGSTLTR